MQSVTGSPRGICAPRLFPPNGPQNGSLPCQLFASVSAGTRRPLLRPTRGIPETCAECATSLSQKQEPCVASSSRRGQFLTLIYSGVFFHVFSLEPSSKREAARAGGGGGGKKRGRWTCYFPSWVRKGGGGSAAKGPTFDFVGRR